MDFPQRCFRGVRDFSFCDCIIRIDRDLIKIDLIFLVVNCHIIHLMCCNANTV